MKFLKTRMSLTKDTVTATIYNCGYIGCTDVPELPDFLLLEYTGKNEADLCRQASEELGTKIACLSDIRLYITNNPEKFTLLYTDECESTRSGCLTAQS